MTQQPSASQQRRPALERFQGQKVVVTGGAGFIGSHVVDQLVAVGARVVVIDNLVNGKPINLEHHAKAVSLEAVDIRDAGATASILAGCSVVLHLACLGVRHSIHSPAENHDVNATATLQLLQLAKDLGVERFVTVSSSEVYGTARHVPMTEDHPTFPMTVYGSAKLAGERYTQAFFSTYGYPTTVVRPFNAYGPRSHHEGDCGEVIPKFILRAMARRPLIIFGEGLQTRDFTYVEDSALGILMAAASDEAIGSTINLGYGEEVSVTSLAKLVAHAVGVEVHIEHHPARPGDVLRLYADTSLARSLLGFRPTVRLEAGLSRLVQWFEAGPCTPEVLLRDEVPLNWRTPSSLPEPLR